MAYLKRFIGFIVILGLLAGVMSIPSAISKTVQQETPSGTLRKVATIRQKYTENQQADRLDKALQVRLVPGTTFRADSKSTPTAERRCKSLVYKTLMKLPYSHRSQLSELTLFYTNDGRRGLGGNGKVVLRCLNVDDAELVSVLVHEMGHLVDGGMLTGFDTRKTSGFYDFSDPVLADDPSARFYSISWESNVKRVDNATERDFVSLYGASDPFEDFAETYIYYLLHGTEFRRMLGTSSQLEQKYNFMKFYVFGGEEFGTESDVRVSLNIWKRYYDTTVLPFPLESFLT